MERHKCKLCSKGFANGRALGGHMRSHLANLPIPPKTQLGDRTESASSLSSSSEEEEEEEEEEEKRESEEKALVYGLRENPKKSFRLVDPEFLDAGSVVVQDRESETESSRNPTGRRSKRTRKSRRMGFYAEDQGLNKSKLRKTSSTESAAELEQVSSVSDTSPEEDVALCLMMLSRDTWSSDELRPSQRKKYQCETCKKLFRSFQALGGHRTSHPKVNRTCFQDDNGDESQPPQRSNVDQKQKLHECPICYRVFGSGQALGGHKRSHLLTSTSSSSKSATKFGESLIDLNLPAPMEDDDCSQLEVSAVSDADEFINQTLTHHS